MRESSLSRAQPERSLNLLDRALTAYREAGTHETPRAWPDNQATSIAAIEAGWKETQATLKKLHRNQTDGEEMVRALEDQLEEQRKRDAETRAADEQTEAAEPKEFKTFSMRAAGSGYESEEVNRIKAEIDKVQAVIQKEKAAFTALTVRINEGLRLKGEHVLAEFSQLSGIPASKLNRTSARSSSTSTKFWRRACSGKTMS